MSSAVHCVCFFATNGRRMPLIVAQKGNPSAAQVIARSMAEPPIRSKNAKIWEMPSRAPRDSPKPTFLTTNQRKRLETVPQTKPIKTRRTISFIEQLSEVNDLAYG